MRARPRRDDDRLLAQDEWLIAAVERAGTAATPQTPGARITRSGATGAAGDRPVLQRSRKVR